MFLREPRLPKNNRKNNRTSVSLGYQNLKQPLTPPPPRSRSRSREGDS